MQDIPEKIQDTSQPVKGKGFSGICAVIIRWLFIILFAAILLGGLYFKAPWKILTLDATLLALLTIVPKSWRKYGWLTLAVAILALTVWIFIPEKDTGDWKPYTFDKELAALEAKRAVPPDTDAAHLYEALFGWWQQIEEADPFPEKADECGQTIDRPWTASEFPEVAAWLDRHKDFFQDVMTAAQKPNCYFPAGVTTCDFSAAMERLSPPKQFAQHLIRASQLDIGEHRSGAWQKQVAALNLGKHMNQQPMLLDVLVGIAIESLTLDAMLHTLIDTDQLSHLTEDEYLAAVEPIRTSHFDAQQKWRQVFAYERLLAKNFFGMFYEINPEGKIRFSRFKSLINAINETCPNEEISELEVSYWKGVYWKFLRMTFWLSGLPKNPAVISEWIDDAYNPLKQGVKTEPDEFFENVIQNIHPFKLNYKYLVYQLSQIAIPSYEKIGEILNQVQTKKNGAELVCNLVYYKLQHGQFPDTLKQLSALHQDEPNLALDSEGFVYKKTEESFVLYHIGPNKIDEKGVSRICEYDPNDGQMKMKTLADDVLIWPKKLEGDN